MMMSAVPVPAGTVTWRASAPSGWNAAGPPPTVTALARPTRGPVTRTLPPEAGRVAGVTDVTWAGWAGAAVHGSVRSSPVTSGGRVNVEVSAAAGEPSSARQLAELACTRY